MIEKILIKNYLLLKDIEINFSNGFNIITGETGTGKSILINAISLLLGERADYSIISKNKEKMIVEAHIKRTKYNDLAIKKFIKEKEIESFDEYLIIRRELYTKAYSRNFVNDSPVNINDLKELGESIVDIHSQNEHQSLLKKEIHIQLLNSFLSKQPKIDFNKQLDDYKLNFAELIKLSAEFDELKNKKTELENKRTFFEFQLKEINDVDPKEEEDDILEKELKTFENIEYIQQGLTSAHSHLYDDEGSVLERMKLVEKELGKIKEFNKEIHDILNDITQVNTTINESVRLIYDLMNTLNYDPVKIENIRERLYKLQFIKKKYGSSLNEVIKLRNNVQQDLSLLDNFDDRIKSVENNIKELKDSLYKKASSVSKLRKENAKKIESEIIKVLREVGFENAEFKVHISPLAPLQGRGENDFNYSVKKGEYVRLSENGIDDVEFMVKINKGDDFSSLRKTASGGEVSRIMLAVKNVLADADNVDVLIFDEIDTGISGRIAQKVGRVLKKLSEYHQVISITHLAQIAALAEQHFVVSKDDEGDKTYTKIQKLNNNERVMEIAKLLSGEKVTDASIKSAKELISS
jgi:DNA repair protein RecN (Recombination protein N)